MTNQASSQCPKGRGVRKRANNRIYCETATTVFSWLNLGFLEGHCAKWQQVRSPRLEKPTSVCLNSKHAWFSRQVSYIRSPAAHSLEVGSGGEGRSLCSPCCFVRTEGSAEADHEASAAVSWTREKELFVSHLFPPTAKSLF